MGRRRRRRQQQPQPPPPARSPRLSGAKAGALALFLLGFFETVGPTLCTPRAPDMRVASDAGEPMHTPVPAETLADGSVGGVVVDAFYPAPAPRQHRPPCPAKTVERNGGCWVRAAHDPPCTFFEVLDSGACWIAVPERPKGAPVADLP